MHEGCWEKLSSNKKTETQKNVNGKKLAEQQNWYTYWNEKAKLIYKRLRK